MARYRLGVDVGGTFTDFLLMDETSGRHHALKVASTAEHPSAAILEGVRRLAEAHGAEPAEIASFVHGTTLAVNTLIQRTGATVGLLVTDGYRDILELRRLRLSDPSQLYAEKPVPIARRRHVREIRERLLADGSEYRPLDLDEVEAAARALVADGVEAIAVAFLHAYRNPAHENAAKARIEACCPGVYVCTSSEIWPQQREYERTLVAAINAHVGGRMAEYFTALERELRDVGVPALVCSTKSNGGIMTARSAAAVPVETLLSGPASGVIGAAFVAHQIGEPRLITLDMGGTSADVAVVDGDVAYSTESHVGDFPVLIPAIEVSSIGAGGGSVAWLDAEGVLKVGPRSVGANPGPACYGRGGTEPTVTDAYVTLGIIDPDHFLGGTLRLQPELARRALAPIADGLGCDVEGAARAVLEVATANMYAEFMPLMARRGVDPRDFALFAYGGAGPVHAFLLAREVGITRVIVPPTPGVLCALGCLVADFRADFIRTLHVRCRDLAAGELEGQFAALEASALAWLAEQQAVAPAAGTDGLSGGGAAGGRHAPAPQIVRTADMRYVGQSFEITVPVPKPLVEQPGSPDLLDAFHAQYERIYGYSDPLAPAEIANIRVQIVGETPKPTVTASGNGRVPSPQRRESPLGSTDGSDRQLEPPEPTGWRTVSVDQQPWRVPIFERSGLRTGMTLDGPCIVEQYDSTVFVTPEFTVRVDWQSNLVASRRESARG